MTEDDQNIISWFRTEIQPECDRPECGRGALHKATDGKQYCMVCYVSWLPARFKVSKTEDQKSFGDL